MANGLFTPLPLITNSQTGCFGCVIEGQTSIQTPRHITELAIVTEGTICGTRASESCIDLDIVLVSKADFATQIGLHHKRAGDCSFDTYFK